MKGFVFSERFTNLRPRVIQEGGIFGAVTTTDAILEKIGFQ